MSCVAAVSVNGTSTAPCTPFNSSSGGYDHDLKFKIAFVRSISTVTDPECERVRALLQETFYEFTLT